MKNEQVKQIIRLSVFPALLMILGLVLAINPDSAAALVSKVLAWILILCGSARILVILIDRDSHNAGAWLWSAAFLCGGFFLLRHSMILAKGLGIVLGILLAAEGADGLRTGLRLKSAGGSFPAGLILSIATFAAGCILIFVPLTASRLTFTVCGVVLVAVGAVSLVSRILDFRHFDPPDAPNIIDADE